MCLSLLGTWSGGAGENWSPSNSTLLQVLVSIQSLILVPEPYFNEPGYERLMGTSEGNMKSKNYNSQIVIANMQYGMLEHLNKLSSAFSEVYYMFMFE